MATIIHEQRRHFSRRPANLVGRNMGWRAHCARHAPLSHYARTRRRNLGSRSWQHRCRRARLGAAIWSGLALLIALFVGGMAATRLGMIYDRATGAFEGALVWVLSFVAILWLASSGVQLVASGISSVFSGVTQTIGSATGGMDDLSTGDVEQMLARLNDPRTVRTISTATGIPEQEVRSSLGEMAQRVEAARDNPEQAAAEVRRGAEQLMSRARQQLPAAAERVQNTATKTAWITFAAMLISLIAAVAGAMAGRKRAAQRLVGDPRATASTVR